MSEYTADFQTVPTYIYQPVQNAQGALFSPEEDLLLESSLLSSEEDTLGRAKASAAGKTPQEARGEMLAIMKSALLQAISQTCVSLIEHSRERLKRQYEIAREEMEAIHKKNA
jgi:hypothetical protein